MAVTAQERKLLIGGEWVETGDWVDGASPYSGETVGRVAKAGANEARRAIDAAEAAMSEPLPAHKRAEILVRVAGYLGKRHDEAARTVSEEAGKPMKAARVEAMRAMSTYTFAAVEARKLADGAAKKRVNLELGNATPVIVAADADIDSAAQAMAANAFSFAGQSCISVQRIYVEAPAYDRFVEQFLPKVGELMVGDPADEETDVGPVIDESSRERIRDWIEEARASGARVLAGGDTDGDLIRPTVIANAGPELKVSCEEVFGPVCTVNSVGSVDEAIELANGTRYGLQAGIFTSKLETAMHPAEQRAGG